MVLSFNQKINFKFPKGITLSVKREDLLHPYISGNKFRKLKYNLQAIGTSDQRPILTFGGAFSNHIAAVAYAGKFYGFQTIGVIRGEELKDQWKQNPTLVFAAAQGMQLYFVSREAYREKEDVMFQQKLIETFGKFHLIPEGGTNDLAIKGCEEILTDEDLSFDHICCAVGTGGTISGLINSAKSHQKVLGFPALKGDFLQKDIRKFAKNNRWELIQDFHFGGYGKFNDVLIAFINEFYNATQVPLDPIYTGKMVFGVLSLINDGYFPEGSQILLIHTGGLQGIAGVNIQLEKKQRPLIQY